MENGTSLMSYMIKITTAFREEKKSVEVKIKKKICKVKFFSTCGGNQPARTRSIGSDIVERKREKERKKSVRSKQ